MARGNQREKAREKNLKAQASIKKQNALSGSEMARAKQERDEQMRLKQQAADERKQKELQDAILEKQEAKRLKSEAKNAEIMAGDGGVSIVAATPSDAALPTTATEGDEASVPASTKDNEGVLETKQVGEEVEGVSTANEKALDNLTLDSPKDTGSQNKGKNRE